MRHSRFEDLTVDPGCASIVLTDPPYTREAMCDGTWERLGNFAGRVLKPGGLLITYAPTMWLPRH